MSYTESDVCKHCGEKKKDHCIFEAIMIPEGCVCPPGDWGDCENIPEICDKYIKEVIGGEEFCETCQHSKECHDNKKFNEKRV